MDVLDALFNSLSIGTGFVTNDQGDEEKSGEDGR
jgi:hypothetical protein